MTDEVTTGRGYQLPYPSNQLSYDVTRLRAALGQIDGDVAALLTALAGKAAATHSHTMDDVAGLVAALAGKAAAAHTHTLGALSDVSVTGAAAGYVIRYSGTGWTASQIAIADVSGLSAQIAALQTSITNMADGTY